MPTILLKKSDTASAVPGTANLTNLAGGVEVAVNTADKRMFTMNSSSAVVELGTNPGSLTCADASFTVARIGSLTISSLSLSNATVSSATVTNLTSTSATVTQLVNTSATISTLLNLTGRAALAAGTASAPTLYNVGSTNTGIYSPTAGTIGFAVSGSLKFYILSSVAYFWSNTSFGYGTTSGGAVTQATSRTTGVTINFCSGAITLVSAAGTTAWQTFLVTNNKVEVDDVIIVNQKSGTDLYEIHVTSVQSGGFRLSFRTTGGTTVEQPVFSFAVIKGSVS